MGLFLYQQTPEIMKILDIKFPDSTEKIRPVSRAKLPILLRLLIEIQAIWIEEEFSVGDAIAREDCWDLISQVWILLPLATSNKATLTPDSLELLSSDYEQLSNLFFGNVADAYDGNISEFDLRKFEGCALLKLHEVSPRKKLLAADQLRQERSQRDLSNLEISQSPAVATQTETTLQI